MEKNVIVNKSTKRPALRWFNQTFYVDQDIKQVATQINIICGKTYLNSTHLGKCYNPTVKWLDKVKGIIEVTYYKLTYSPYELGKQVEIKCACNLDIKDFRPLKQVKTYSLKEIK